MYGSDLASLTDTVASLYTKQKVKHSVRKRIPNKVMVLWYYIILICVWFWLSKETFGDQYLINTLIRRTHRPFHFSHCNFDEILKMLAYLSASKFTSKSNHCSLIGHEILLFNPHTYCMISFMHVREINDQTGLGSLSGVR